MNFHFPCTTVMTSLEDGWRMRQRRWKPEAGQSRRTGSSRAKEAKTESFFYLRSVSKDKNYVLKTYLSENSNMSPLYLRQNSNISAIYVSYNFNMSPVRISICLQYILVRTPTYVTNISQFRTSTCLQFMLVRTPTCHQ